MRKESYCWWSSLGPSSPRPSCAASQITLNSILTCGQTAALILEQRGSIVTHILLNVIMQLSVRPPLFVQRTHVGHSLTPAQGLNPTVIIVLVHLNRSLGTHSTKRYDETISTVRFGGRCTRAVNSLLDSVTTAGAATMPGVGSADKSESTLDGAGVEEKTTVETHEKMHFTDDDAMEI